MRPSIQLVLLTAVVLAVPAAARAQDMRQTLSEEIRLQHERSRELNQIGQQDQQMAQNLNNQAQSLIDHATRLEQRAQMFRQMAANERWPRNQQMLGRFAEESEKYARSDRANVDFRRRVANDMAASANGAFEAARKHEDHAMQMQQFLDQMNQGQRPPPPPVQQRNPWQ